MQPSRYKGAYGGRGGAKSHFFAEQLIIRCYAATTRAACIREVQNTIKDSVKQLLTDKIQKFGLGSFFEVLDAEIRGKNGSLIIFKGMQSYNAENIKSLENFDIAWVEEAQTLSAHSLKLLRPTIRKDASELWFSWNPRHDTDAVDKFFRGGAVRTGMVSVSVNWNDNPWFPDVLRQEKEDDFFNDPEIAENVWGGGYELITEGSYYGKLIAVAEKEGRIGHYPYDTLLPVKTSWDLGVDDYTSIWFWQENGHEAYVIDFYEISNAGAQEIVELALPELTEDVGLAAAQLVDLGRPQPFRYGVHYLPHDIKVREWGAGARQRSLTLMGLGVKPLHIGVQTNPADRIAASRKLMPVVHFNDTARVRIGISHLRRFSRKKNEQLGIYSGILHDEHSHAADAFGEFAINCSIVPKPKMEDKIARPITGQVYIPGPPEPRNTTRIRL